MKSNESTPAWVQPVDGATCAALSRELWGMLSAERAEMSVVEFCDYITSATLAFQREYAAAEWGETHDWMEETERFLARYLREFPIRALEDAGVRHADPLPVSDPYVERQLRDYEAQQAAVLAVRASDAAISYAERVDTLCDSGGRELAVMLQRADIPCVHYGDGDLVILWGVSSRELRVHITADGETAEAEVFLVTPGAEEDYETVAEGLTLADTVKCVRGFIQTAYE